VPDDSDDPELRAAARNCMETTVAVEVTAELLTEGPERQRLYDRMVEQLPQFGDYQKATDRVIPVVVLNRNGN
jgi:hypothetical protein